MIIMSIAPLEAQSDREFMEQLYQDNKRIMFHTARKYVKSPQDQEDIVQSAIEKMIKKISLLRAMDCCKLTGYIVNTIRNTAIDFIQKRDKINCHNIGFDENKLDASEIEPYLLEKSLLGASNRLREIWPELLDDDRFLLEGKYIWGLTDRELSLQLHCKQDSVRMKLTRARRRALELISKKEIYDDKT